MTRFIAFVSGKGGAGKTTAVLNLGQSLTLLGKRVLLLDANFLTPNLASHLGVLSPSVTLNEFLQNKRSIHESIIFHPSGLAFLTAGISYQEARHSQARIAEIIEHLDHLADFVLVDCPAGIGSELSKILAHTDETIIIANPNLSSVVDALKAIELAKTHNNSLPGFILNMTSKGKHELKAETVENTLNLPLAANIPFDKKIKKALYKQAPSVYLYPRSKSSKRFLGLAKEMIR
ncbi:MAG: P-loop NTPase [Candidatus Woesearchaeota archaeon]